ncbi:MAG: NAD-dependent epimerase/dehydratase family protein [Clostridium celatum]|uniref:NAD-dependent epimerase/dehydratase family protein n=1 Tax=Clostridium sp. TaxID=1506 RepID=UPI0025C11492|nr:NAD-dependent epimerase/dehydratase family protein [Clostridium sp.]MDU2122987.1 NAD-dependent epimerase/dehydratase family protein [Clostridium celatum]MBS4957627.1 NAD-dependent epimerase/dehydratase family protein [Clostridium sp.]MDU4884564.1 NAD-dependent epimerase/dehydratase family protein [Clostridium celatum]MDU4978315.1 NAD-dependent epimerase/dehydratase family protein [Clostridium celatum]MDU7077734.1 NAD-dependent epimerase/dehydratase family protein [Clostridium celatum]
MKILITGVYGIVGSFLASNLMNEHEVIGIGRREQYDGCHKYYSCDITNKDEIEKIIKENKDLDFIIHCAALAHNKGNDLSYDRFIKVNYEATADLIDLSNKYLKLKDFIFISTISVYGESLDKKYYLEDDSCNPRSPYAVAKKKSEDYIISKYKGKYSILRLNPVYSKDFLLNIQRRTLIKGITYKVGDGMQKLTLCHIRNIYEAVNYLINNCENEISEIYNIGDSRVYYYKELVEKFNGKSKVTIPKFAFAYLYKLNSLTLKKQFIHENSIKLISDNIYSSDKINKKVNLKYTIKDI